MLPITLRPRTTTELIDASVQLLRQHYKELVTVSAFFMMPAILVSVLLSPQQLVAETALSAKVWVGLALSLALQVVAYSTSTAATVVIVSDSYLGREVTIGAAVQRVMERIWTVLRVVLLQSLIIGVGFVFLFIPGLIFTALYFASTIVVMVEGKSSARQALSRSKELADGSVGRILGALALTGFIVAGAETLINALLVAFFVSFRNGTVVTEVVPYVVRIFLYPFANVVITLLYYDLRIRKEGFDLEIMAKDLDFGQAAPAAP